ncbi:ATP-binding protein [Streptomyces sp. NPDC001817]|uniref:sensor histidine kinase n=1 Tax=Streptomyces sp. NPDC001817 TaxID=3154398 RepID=UPI003333DDF0
MKVGWGQRLTDFREALRPSDMLPERLSASSSIKEALEPFQLRGVLLKATLRVLVAVYIAVQLAVAPPRWHSEVYSSAAYWVAAAYAVISVMLLVMAARNRRWFSMWLGLVFDLAAVTTVLAMSGTFTLPSTVRPFISQGLYAVIPLLAAFQLNAEFTAISGTAATAAYVITAWVGHQGLEPLRVILSHAGLIVVVTVGCTMLSWLQQVRVIRIADLAQQRSRLLSQTMSSENQDRRLLAETLHDGPLQCVFAVLQDIDEARTDGDCETLSRAHATLLDVSRQLRASVTELHPEVLERAGLEQALHDLAARCEQRAGFAAHVMCDAPTLGSDLDRLLYNCARELLANIAKHAQARNVSVRVTLLQDHARLEVTDDGVGLPLGAWEGSIAKGHIGLGSQRIRMEEAGGAFVVRNKVPHGTVAVATVPLGSRRVTTDGASLF